MWKRRGGGYVVVLTAEGKLGTAGVWTKGTVWRWIKRQMVRSTRWTTANWSVVWSICAPHQWEWHIHNKVAESKRQLYPQVKLVWSFCCSAYWLVFTLFHSFYPFLWSECLACVFLNLCVKALMTLYNLLENTFAGQLFECWCIIEYRPNQNTSISNKTAWLLFKDSNLQIEKCISKCSEFPQKSFNLFTFKNKW